MDLQWWIAVIGVPGVGSIMWLIFKVKNDAEREAKAAERRLQTLSDDLHNFKLRTAETYATLVYMKDVEHRIMGQLEKIDDKLERVMDRNRMVDRDGRADGH